MADSNPIPPPVAEEEASIPSQEDISAEATQPDSMNIDSANDTKPEEDEANKPVEAKIPAKKDATLREFLGKMDDYAPIIPDAVTNYYLTLAGLPPPPETPIQLARLMALATQKFIADIAADSYQYARVRASNTASSNPMGGAGVPVVAGAAGAASGTAKEAAGKAAQNLGVQRPGYGGGGQGGSGQGKTILTMEDLGMAVGEYGINVKRPDFYR
ncbi:transcription initiation factor IID TAF10 subunit [Venturia nashicola]|uniref:Transcription initiation factor TFIID subunit 10 n=1 Tax=Venturia nashicola TaxID=86259 RepID=A0A4Z1NZI8_9PEZI|nr:transcription initiation factor IID TAF10 subunit [Venturia nashicola]TLD34770.1 transcription initiation factor IID TAF10 subunit [Venturia nashicola]